MNAMRTAMRSIDPCWHGVVVPSREEERDKRWFPATCDAVHMPLGAEDRLRTSIWGSSGLGLDEVAITRSPGLAG